MDSTSASNINSTYTGSRVRKRCYQFGNTIAVPIHGAIAKQLGLNEDVFVEEEITDEGILLRIRRE